MKKGKGKGRGKGKGKPKGKVAAIDEKSDIKQIEAANSSGIKKNKEEVFCDGGQSMTSEVQHIGETSPSEKRKARYMYWVPIIGVTATSGQLGDQEIYCIVDVLDTDTTQNQKFMPNMLGDGALKVYFADECSMVLEEIKLDFKDWYSSKYNNFRGKSNNDWWKYVEYDLKKLFRGIVKLFTKLSPDFSRGNGMGGVPIFYGKLYNMKYDGYEGYLRDIKRLHQIIENVLMRLPPEDGSSDAWHVQRQDLMRLYKGSRLKGLDKFMLDLKNIDKQNQQVPWYCPFFWSQKERFYFMEKAYDIFWVEKKLIRKDAKVTLDILFPLNWIWFDLVPNEGPYRRVFEYEEGKSKVQYKWRVDSIAFWRNSRYHYNDNTRKSEGYKTVEDIEAELNEKFDICSHVFTAICNFIHLPSAKSAKSANRKLRQRLIALGEEMGFFPINANASPASTSTPNSNAS